jgi:GNAT superfamily N-acetyltransferase
VSGLVVAEATVDEIVELRRRVLRDGTPSTDPHLAEDDAAGAFHLAGRRPGEDLVVACVSFLPSPTPHRPDAVAWRFRAMAVDRSLQGTGLGKVILREGFERARARGATAIWASARDIAIPFYEAMGMQVVGDGYVDANTALPHHTVLIDL